MVSKFSIVAIAATLAVGTVFGAAKTGSYEGSAAGLKGSQKVTLVGEYDPDDKTYSEYSGVYYMKVTISKGSSYSIWTDPNEDVSLDVYTNNDDAWVDFDGDALDDGTQYTRLSAGSWYEDDPSKVVFYVLVSGDIGTSVGVYSQSSWRSFVPPGDEDNKYHLSFSESAKTFSSSFLDDDSYWMSATLSKGRMYRIRTEGGTVADPTEFIIESDADTYEVYPDPEYAADTNNSAFVFRPIITSSSATYQFRVVGTAGKDFVLHYQLLKSRKIADHPSIALDAVGYEATFAPGREIASWDYADSIIDEQLFSINLAKGERWVFETEGAAVPLKMVVYDSKENILAENQTLDGVGYDVRAAVEATAAGKYYVGVCESEVGPGEATSGGVVTIRARAVSALEGDPDEFDSLDDTVEGATGLEVLPGNEESHPAEAGLQHGPHRLSATDWADTFVIAARKGITYRVGMSFVDIEDMSPLPLRCEVFTVAGTKETSVAQAELGGVFGGYVEFTASANAAYYVRFTVAGGKSLDYPAYNVSSVAYQAGGGLGILTVDMPGSSGATWSLGSESVKYPAGSSVLVSGTQLVKFTAPSGYKVSDVVVGGVSYGAVASVSAKVDPGTAPTVVSAKCSDTFDPKDDVAAGATALSVKNVDTVYAKRTLWEEDKADYFSLTGTDGYLYDFALRGVEGDAVFSIVNDDLGVLVEDVTSVSQFEMPKTKSKYFIVVSHGTEAATGGAYSLAGKFANVGAIKFAKTAVSAKESAASVAITVNRTAKDGYVRVKYGTVAGTAKPGIDYIAQNGVLEWANGDNKAKTITVSLLPDLVPVYEGNKAFSVQLEPMPEDERVAGEYPALVVGGDVCAVTLTEVSKAGTTAADAYAKLAPKLATVKTEMVPLETGTFYGVLEEDGSSLTNGLPALASVTLTASTAKPSALSAKVALAGKTYTFSAKGWDDGDDEGTVRKEFILAQKVNSIDEETGKTVSVTVTNTLVVTVASGATDTDGDWLRAGGSAELVMNVPDANNKGYQEEIVYRGEIFRNNAKIQDYLTAVTNFTGYYTVALAPECVSSADGIPAGNGYITLTIDNKGTVKAAGMLADGTTKPSISATACALVEDKFSANGWSMLVPLFMAKSPLVFGGTLRLYADESGQVVVDSTRPLVWNNDNAKLTYVGEEGYRILLDPVGGWYDKVVNLQAYYQNYAFEVSTAEITEFPSEALTAGYRFVTDVEPNGTAVDLAGDAFSVVKKSLVKNGSLYDLVGSVNPCNVRVKLARATGLVSGSFSLWSETEDGAKQKEVAGPKHFGVLVLARDAFSPLAEDVISAGFFTRSVKVSDYNEATKKTTTRSWTASLPFNLVGIDQGDVDWWADDWGEQPID